MLSQRFPEPQTTLQVVTVMIDKGVRRCTRLEISRTESKIVVNSYADCRAQYSNVDPLENIVLNIHCLLISNIVLILSDI